MKASEKILPYCLLVIICFAVGCQKNKEASAVTDDGDPNVTELNEYQMKQVKLDTARLEDETTDVMLGGRVSLDMDRDVPVFSFVSGNVLKVNVSLGDYVHKGDVLAVLRSTDLSNNQTQLDAAKAQLALAKRNLDVAHELYDTKVYSQIDLLNAESTYKSAEDAVIALETTMKTYGIGDSNAKAENNVYKIISPIEGYVVGKSITEGANVLEGTSTNLFTISDVKIVWVMCNIYENDLYQVNEGDPVDVEALAYPDKPYKGKIFKISHVLDSASGTAQARIVLDNKGDTLRSDMFVNVQVHVDRHKKAVAIPNISLVYYDNNYYVEKALGKNKFQKTSVSVDGYFQGKAYISKGIQPGDVLVGQGSMYVLGQ